MATITLQCTETPGVWVGPGDVKDGRVIHFVKSFAELDDTAPDFAERMSWINTPGCPFIKVVTPEERASAEAVDDMPAAEWDRLEARHARAVAAKSR